MKINFNNRECDVVFSEYADNSNVSIQLIKKSKRKSKDDLIATATVNTDIIINTDFVAIKGWSENLGIEKALIESEVICPKPVGLIPYGMVFAYVFELSPAAKEFRRKKACT